MIRLSLIAAVLLGGVLSGAVIAFNLLSPGAQAAAPPAASIDIAALTRTAGDLPAQAFATD